MLDKKKVAIAIIAFNSSLGFAGTMGPVCVPGNITTPCEQRAWDFGAQALYLNPTYDAGFDYIGSASNGITRIYRPLTSRWGWGFKIEGSYHYSTGSDINVNWYHYDRKTSRHYLIDIAGIGTDTVFTSKPKWDAVNLEFGQQIDFSPFKKMRLHGGMQYAHIGYSSNGYRAFFPALRDLARIRYNGFGPRVGADLSYSWFDSFSVYAKGAGAVLVGSGNFNVADTVGIFGNTGRFIGSKRGVVPELEGKLGASYSYTMSQGNLNLDAGYMWINYFNANHVSNGGATVLQTDFSLNGPYVGLKWLGNI